MGLRSRSSEDHVLDESRHQKDEDKDNQDADQTHSPHSLIHHIVHHLPPLVRSSTRSEAHPILASAGNVSNSQKENVESCPAIMARPMRIMTPPASGCSIRATDRELLRGPPVGESPERIVMIRTASSPF